MFVLRRVRGTRTNTVPSLEMKGRVLETPSLISVACALREDRGIPHPSPRERQPNLFDAACLRSCRNLEKTGDAQ
jgi:hypothetical protein